MAQERPFFYVGRKSLDGNGTGSIEFSVGASEEFEAHEIRIKATSELFDITEISDEGGVPYTNATSDEPLDGLLLYNATENAFNIVKLPAPLNLDPNSTLKFDLKDTSAATNEVFICLIGVKRTVR